MSIMGNALAHIPPNPFSGIKVGRIWRQIADFEFGMGLRKRFEYPGMMETDIVHIQDDFFSVPVRFDDLAQVLFEGPGIPFLCKPGDQLPCKWIDAPKARNPFPLPLYARCLRLFAHRRPGVGKCRGIAQRKFIFKQHDRVATL